MDEFSPICTAGWCERARDVYARMWREFVIRQVPEGEHLSCARMILSQCVHRKCRNATLLIAGFFCDCVHHARKVGIIFPEVLR